MNHIVAPRPKTAACTIVSHAASERDLAGAGGHMGGTTLRPRLSNTSWTGPFCFFTLSVCLRQAASNNCLFRLSHTQSSPPTVHENHIHSFTISVFIAKTHLITAILNKKRYTNIRQDLFLKKWSIQKYFFHINSGLLPTGDLLSIFGYVNVL